MQKDQLEWLARHGLIESVTVFCGPEGVELWITETGQCEVPLHTARGAKREFASVDTALRFLLSCGWEGRAMIDATARWGCHRVKE